MLLQTNSYIVPKEKRAEHARLMVRFHQCFRRLGSLFEVYEQTGPHFSGDGGGRFVQIMRFRDRRHQQEVHAREKEDKVAQRLISEFCELVNLPYQQQQGLFVAAFYSGVLRDRPGDLSELPEPSSSSPGDAPAPAAPASGGEHREQDVPATPTAPAPEVDSPGGEYDEEGEYDTGEIEPDDASFDADPNPADPQASPR